MKKGRFVASNGNCISWYPAPKSLWRFCSVLYRTVCMKYQSQQTQYERHSRTVYAISYTAFFFISVSRQLRKRNFYQKTLGKSKILPVLGTASDLHKEHELRLGLSCSCVFDSCAQRQEIKKTRVKGRHSRATGSSKGKEFSRGNEWNISHFLLFLSSSTAKPLSFLQFLFEKSSDNPRICLNRAKINLKTSVLTGLLCTCAISNIVAFYSVS